MAPTVTEGAKEAVDEGREKLTGGSSDLGKKLLVPAAAGLGTLAATYAARKAPELFRDRLQPKLEGKAGEELASAGKKAAQQLKGSGGAMGKLAGMASGDGKKTRRLPIQRWTDVAVPIDVAYDKWTQFEEYPKFMHRVLNVQQDDNDENKVKWEEKIWFSKRQWEGEITEREKNDRVAWKTVYGTSHEVVVSFRKHDDKLTRVM